jgi:hypothetical protein
MAAEVLKTAEKLKRQQLEEQQRQGVAMDAEGAAAAGGASEFKEPQPKNQKTGMWRTIPSELQIGHIAAR